MCDTEKMEEKELSTMGAAIVHQMRNEDITEDEIIAEIEKTPELAQVKLSSGSNLFLTSVLWNRLNIAKVLVGLGADVHWKSRASLISGNALNVARTPEAADYLLGLGLEPEKNLSISAPYWNPAIKAVSHNDVHMMLYWLNKEKELFKEDEHYIRELIQATIEMAVTMNQWTMTSRIMADDELYVILKDTYAQTGDVNSIKLYLRALKQVTEEHLTDKKKELTKRLNDRKRELSKSQE